MRTCKCGHQVANNAKACPQCGHRFMSTFTFLVFAVIVGFVVLIIILPNDSTSVSRSPVVIPASSTAPVTPRQPAKVKTTGITFNTGNVASDRLLALPARDQAHALGLAVGSGCNGTQAFYMGMSQPDHSAMWSVGCGDGTRYGVLIEANSSGSTKVLECSMLAAVAGTPCFTKLKNP